MIKEGLAQTTSDITENLMSISRMMAQQVQQSEETMTSLGEWKNLLLIRGCEPYVGKFQERILFVPWA